MSAETTDALEIGLLARIKRVVPVPLRLMNLIEAARWQRPFAQHSLGALFMHERQMVEAEMDDAPGVVLRPTHPLSVLDDRCPVLPVDTALRWAASPRI